MDTSMEPGLTLSEALSSKDVEERDMVVEMDIAKRGTIRQIANPIKFSENQQEYTTAGVASGTHTKEVILELGYLEEDFAGFEREGVFI